MEKPSFIAVDFFCGAGGTTSGLLSAGGYVIAGIDKDDRCRETYVSNNVNGTLDRRPVKFISRDVFPATKAHPSGDQEALLAELDAEIARYRALCPGVPLMFAVCAPCQPFTKLAHAMTDVRKKNRRRDRNLLSVAGDFVARWRPDMVLSENVAAIADPKFGGIWPAFQKKLRGLGYSTGARVVCASEFGVPQFRRRSILIAARTECIPAAMLDGRGRLKVPSSDPEARVVTAAEAIGHLPKIVAGGGVSSVPNHMSSMLSEMNLKRIRASRPGQNNLVLANSDDGDLTLECHRRAKEKAKKPCFSDAWTRLHLDRPASTITTNCHKYSNGRFGHFDMAQDRAISPREAAILQSFPDEYIFHPVHRISPAAHMIGNAVPPKLARFFAGHLARMMGAESEKEAIRAVSRRAPRNVVS